MKAMCAKGIYFLIIAFFGGLVADIWTLPIEEQNTIGYDYDIDILNSQLLDPDNILERKWLDYISQHPVKRGPCHGTACVYSHIGASAGHSSLRRLKLALLRECIDDPLCFSPGKRRRRSAKDSKNA